MFGNNGFSFRLLPGFHAEKTWRVPVPGPGTGCQGSSTALSRQPPRGQPKGIEHRALPRAAPVGRIRSGHANFAPAPRTPWTNCALYQAQGRLFTLPGFASRFAWNRRLISRSGISRSSPGGSIPTWRFRLAPKSETAKEELQEWNQRKTAVLEKEATCRRNYMASTLWRACT